MRSVVFYDLETTGVDPRASRLTQFAALRCAPDLSEVVESENFAVRLDEDVVPHPAALVKSGTDLAELQRTGISELEAVERIEHFLNRPGTLRVGWNSVRFDDAFVRHLRWRTLRGPYAGEKDGGGGRLDLMALYRAARVLAPGMVEKWPLGKNGQPAFNLGDTAEAVGVRVEGDLHDAAVDVRQTWLLAKELRRREPEIWQRAESCAGGRREEADPSILDFQRGHLWLVAEQGLAAGSGCRIVLPVGEHPVENAVLAVDVAHGSFPSYLLASEKELRERVAAPGKRRLARQMPLMKLKLGGSLFLLPVPDPVLGRVLEGMGRDPGEWEQRVIDGRDRLLNDVARTGRAAQIVVLADEAWWKAKNGAQDAEEALYGGGFPPAEDLLRAGRLVEKLRGGAGEGVAALGIGGLKDARVRVLAERMVAKHFPGAATQEMRDRWEEHVRRCRRKGFGDGRGWGKAGRPGTRAFRKHLDEAIAQGANGRVVEGMEALYRRLAEEYELPEEGEKAGEVRAAVGKEQRPAPLAAVLLSLSRSFRRLTGRV